MATLTGDILRLLAAGGINTATNVLGQLLTVPMKERSDIRKAAAAEILRALPTTPQSMLPGAQATLRELSGKELIPTAMVPTGNVIGPTGESLAITPVPGAPVTPEMKLRYIVPQPSLSELKAQTFRQLDPEKQRAIMSGETLGAQANMLNAFLNQRRLNELYGPQGVEREKIRLRQEELGPKQISAQAAMTSAATGRQRLTTVDQPRLELSREELAGLNNYRKMTNELAAAAQKAQNAQEKHKIAINLFNAANDQLQTAIKMEESYRKRNLKPPADVTEAAESAQRMQRNAEVLADQAWKMLSPEEQKATANPQRERDIQIMKERAAQGDPVAIDTLKRLGF